MGSRATRFKIWVRLVGIITVVLVLAWAGMTSWVAMEQRRLAIEQSRDFALSVHQMAMASLITLKVTKRADKRAIYLDQVKKSNSIKELRVVRGQPVLQQFGDGSGDEEPHDDIERRVLADGKPYFGVMREGDSEFLRAVTPAISVTNYLGRSCVECHDEHPEGTVLGAVSMKISLDRTNVLVRESRLKMVGVAAAITLPLLLIVYFFIARVVNRPLRELTEGLKDIAEGEGDLTRRLPIRGRDEIGEASATFNQMMDKFQGLIARVSASASQVSASARALTAGNGSAASAGALDRMVTSIATVAQAGDELQALSEESLRHTAEGNESLQELGRRIGSVEAAVRQMVEKVNGFVRSAESISAMTREVQGIAHKTNLLALNATIEAARAGEHGRGFAVVAAEVRSLAGKSASSASAIEAISRTMGDESIEVRAAIEQGLHVLRTSDASMRTVAGVLSQAKQAAQAVHGGANGIAGATQENSRAIEKVADAAKELEQLAAALRSEMARFKA